MTMLEPRLAERLRAEAERLDVTAPSFGALARHGRRRGIVQTAAKGLLVVALIGASAGIGLVVTRDDAPVERASRGIVAERPPRLFEDFPRIAPPPAPPAAGEDEFTLGGTGTTGSNTGGSPGSASGAGGGGGSQPAPEEADVISPPAQGAGNPLATPRVIKTARLRVEVEEDTLGATFSDVERLAGRSGGFVSDSFTRSNPARSGELTIRVPAVVFESVVADLKSLGSVESQRISGVDVTADFVDLAARLRNWEAQEHVLVRLMGEANTINESLQVQRELQGVRVEIERIQGQLRVLRDQTDLASISLAIHEPGVAEESTDDQGAWDRALSAAGKVFEAMVVGLGYLVPILAALVILWLLTRAVRSRRTV
jgi:hypothetical protein